MQTTSNIDYFHGRFSVLGTKGIIFKLKILKSSHLHHSESTIHQDLMIEVVIPEKNYNVSLWSYTLWNIIMVHQERWIFFKYENIFTIVEQNFNLRHEIILLVVNEFCSMNKCDVCQNNKFTTDLENSPLIDLKLVRK